MRYQWPGNVRELRNAADRFVLGLGLDLQTSVPNVSSSSGVGSLSSQLADYERVLIENEIARNGGTLKSTYENLGISRKSLYEKMKRLGLNRD